MLNQQAVFFAKRDLNAINLVQTPLLNKKTYSFLLIVTLDYMAIHTET